MRAGGTASCNEGFVDAGIIKNALASRDEVQSSIHDITTTNKNTCILYILYVLYILYIYIYYTYHIYYICYMYYIYYILYILYVLYIYILYIYNTLYIYNIYRTFNGEFPSTSIINIISEGFTSTLDTGHLEP